MNTRSILLVGLLTTGCWARPAPAPAPPKAPTLDVAALEATVLAGIRADYADECYAGPLWGSIDRAEGGQRLDAIVAALTTKERTSREEVCGETIAIARLLRLVRTKSLDLGAELAHASAAVREVTARYAEKATVDARAAAQLRVLLEDPDLGVRLEAHDAIEAHRDRAAIPALQRIAARRDDQRVMACGSLHVLGAPGDCEPPPKSEGGLLGSVMYSGQPVDYCAEARSNIASADVKRQISGALFFLSEQFDVRAKDLTSLPEAHDSECFLSAADRDKLLASTHPTLRAVAAAITLWTRP